ncbi:tripartite tricarboxylate transporter TctB family protein [Limisalsivibrio acetivorans]|uniref:tripartite tricarboxylate transporter TctB family protein n=1 Tax=Limisalsivibrio acetivorans TaxID=1304888 RepID=UPI0003B3589B|nr:tripartite tricarboxylate transporter TctB family protein [Limisalsivibrio acetivorans]
MSEKAEKKSTNSRGELFVPALMAGFLGVYLFQTADAPRVAMVWPYIIIGFTSLLLMIVLFNNREKLLPSAGSKESRKHYKKPAILIALTIVYLTALPFAGFTLSSFIYLVSVLFFLGVHSVFQLILVPGIICAFLYLSLIKAMQISLPSIELFGISF